MVSTQYVERSEQHAESTQNLAIVNDAPKKWPKTRVDGSAAQAAARQAGLTTKDIWDARLCWRVPYSAQIISHHRDDAGILEKINTAY
jgi:hypothetical protein